MIEQLDFLETSADRYDNGVDIEAKRMASTLRILLHDTSNSISLLKSLNLKNTKFHDTATQEGSNVKTTHIGLAYRLLGCETSSKYSVLLDQASVRLIDFDNWWDTIVLKDIEGNSFSRKNVVLIMANQDGGSHVDPSIDRTYHRVKTGESLGQGWSLDGNNWFNMEGAELATVRQIAHEVLKTLKSSYSKQPAINSSAIVLGTGIRVGVQENINQNIDEPTNMRVGRNDQCPCGSGIKFKKCCGA